MKDADDQDKTDNQVSRDICLMVQKQHKRTTISQDNGTKSSQDSSKGQRLGKSNQKTSGKSNIQKYPVFQV